MDIFAWIEQELKPKVCTSEEFIYNDMDSQSSRCLPIIYEPFDIKKRAHWQDRGSLFDYLSSVGEKKLLDFGPGDGWPSLVVAPYVDEVVGVEGSRRRVEVCTENAERLGISNASFAYVEPGTVLPFEDNSFDGIMVATAIEQTPDPKDTLRQLFRVLQNGGRLRIAYEALSRYRGGQKQDLWLYPIDDQTCRLILYDRCIDRERVRQYGVTFAMDRQHMIRSFPQEGGSLSFNMVTIPLLKQACSAIIDTRMCTLTHPSGATLVSWLHDIGFREVNPSHSGAEFAGQLFDHLSEEHLPKDINAVDKMLQPLVRIVVQMPAPLSIDPMITAIK